MLLWEMEGRTIDAALKLFDSTCWMKEEFSEDLKHPRDNYDGPFQTFSLKKYCSRSRFRLGLEPNHALCLRLYRWKWF